MVATFQLNPALYHSMTEGTTSSTMATMFATRERRRIREAAAAKAASLLGRSPNRAQWLGESLGAPVRTDANAVRKSPRQDRDVIPGSLGSPLSRRKHLCPATFC